MTLISFPLASVNFINVLCAAFVCAEPKSVKKFVTSSVFLRFQDLLSKKLQVNMLVKSTPACDVNSSITYLSHPHSLNCCSSSVTRTHTQTHTHTHMHASLMSLFASLHFVFSHLRFIFLFFLYFAS